MICCFFASPWPTGFEPTGVLTKSRFRSSGVTELCWTNSQCSPSKSHPKYPQSLKHLQKLSETQILEELFYSNSSHKNHHLLFFLLHLDQPGLSPPEFLQKAGSGVVVWQNGVGQIHNVVRPNPTQHTHNPWNIFKIQFLPKFGRVVLFKFFTQTSLFVVFLLHLDQPGLSPPEFLQKPGSGVVVLQNGVGQIHSIVHPNPTQNTHNSWNIFKNYLKPRFWKSCFIQILHIRIITCCFFCFTLTNRVWAHRSSYKKQVPE